jgi:hypothetical protein
VRDEIGKWEEGGVRDRNLKIAVSGDFMQESVLERIWRSGMFQGNLYIPTLSTISVVELESVGTKQ